MATEAAVTRKVTTTLAVPRSNTETPRKAMKADKSDDKKEARGTLTTLGWV